MVKLYQVFENREQGDNYCLRPKLFTVFSFIRTPKQKHLQAKYV